MSKKLELKPHQKVIYDWLLDNKRTIICSFMGSGKTSSCLTALQDLSLTEDVYPVLIIAPILVAKSTWPNEIKKWQHTENLRVSTIVGDVKERELALSQDSDIYTTNYENLPWLVERLGKSWQFNTVIADECTKLKGFRTRQGSKRAKALAKVAHTMCNRMVLLTGTPAPNGLLDLWGQYWFVDKGVRLGKSFTTFCERWFYSDYSGFNWIPQVFAQDQIQDAIKDVSLTIRAEDWFDLDLPIVNKIVIPLPKKAEALYRKMEKEMFIEIEKNPVEAMSEGSKSMKCRQIAAGAIYTENGVKWENIHDEKLAALESIIEENPEMPIIVSYHFKSDLEKLRLKFPDSETLNNDPTVEQRWNEGKIPMLLVHPNANAHGLNLQDGGNIIVFYSMDWRLEEHLQIIERIGPMRQKQSGHARSVFVHYLMMQDTIDEDMYERLSSKKSVQEILMAAASRHKNRK